MAQLFSITWGHHRYIIDKGKNVEEAGMLNKYKDSKNIIILESREDTDELLRLMRK